MKKHKATTAILMEKRKLRKDNTHPIVLRITFQRECKYYTIRDTNGKGLAFSEMDFLKITGNKPRAEFKEMAFYLNGFEERAANVISELPVFTFNSFEEKFFNDYGDKENLFAALKTTSEKLKSEGRVSTGISFSCTLNSLKSFTGKENFSFTNVDITFLNDYEKWMLKKDKSETSVGIYLRNVRTAFNEAIDKGVVKREQYPFGRKKYEIPTGRNIKKAIKLDEIKKIRAYKSSENSNEQRFRDYWLFSFLSNGMNVKDMARLKYSNINGELISFLRAKTKRGLRQKPKLISVFKTQDIDKIIQKWGNDPVTLDTYVFPVLEKGLTPEQEYKKIHQTNKLMRKYIGRIAKKIGVSQSISNMTARHSWASALKRSGASTEFISESLGHNNLRTTENYLADFDTKEKRKWAEQMAQAVAD